MEEVDEKGIPYNRQSEMYFLLHNNFLYPPKYILSIANLYANNVELDPSHSLEVLKPIIILKH
jgi:hypothetical protein